MIIMSFLALLVGVPEVLTVGIGQQGQSGTVRGVIVREEVTIRIPIRPRPAPQFRWQEEKGPKCLPRRAIAGALLSGKSSIDFILTNRQRVRAKLDDDCPALDYYDRLYAQPVDDYICAERDMIYSRIGGACRIDKFKTLVPKAKK